MAVNDDDLPATRGELRATRGDLRAVQRSLALEIVKTNARMDAGFDAMRTDCERPIRSSSTVSTSTWGRSARSTARRSSPTGG